MKIFSKYFWRDIKYKIRDYFWPRQKWLLRNVPKHWCDKVELIPILLFEILVHFVEEEMDNVSWDWQAEVDAGRISQKEADKVKTVGAEIRDVYNYIKFVRPNLQIQLDNSYFSFSQKGTYEELYAETNRLEKFIEEQDEWAMQTILANRLYLWT